MGNAQDLTARQQEVLDYVRAHARREGKPPTMQEIGRALAMRSTAGVHRIVSLLVERGHLSRAPREARGIALSGVVHVEPAAALPIEGSAATLVVDSTLLSGADPDRCLILRAGGNYTAAAILRGDLLVIERVPASTLDADSLVVVRLEGGHVALRRRDAPEAGVVGRIRAVVRALR